MVINFSVSTKKNPTSNFPNVARVLRKVCRFLLKHFHKRKKKGSVDAMFWFAFLATSWYRLKCGHYSSEQIIQNVRNIFSSLGLEKSYVCNIWACVLFFFDDWTDEHSQKKICSVCIIQNNHFYVSICNLFSPHFFPSTIIYWAYDEFQNDWPFYIVLMKKKKKKTMRNKKNQ